MPTLATSQSRSLSLNKLTAIDMRLDDILRDREGRGKFAEFLRRYGGVHEGALPPLPRFGQQKGSCMYAGAASDGYWHGPPPPPPSPLHQ